MELVIGRKPGNKFCERIAQLTEEAKKNTEWRKQYMEWERQMAYKFSEGKEAGIAEGIQHKSVEDAMNLLKKDIPAETISECIGLPLEQVLELKKQITVKV